MQGRTLFLVLIVSVLSSVPLPASAALDELVYVALGDSVAAGAELGERVSYPRRLGERIANETGRPVRYWNRGRDRAESWTVLTTQLDVLPEVRPHVITLTVGANDFLIPTLDCIGSRIDNVPGNTCDVPDPRVTIQRFEANLRHIVGRVTGETDAAVVLTTYYNPFPRGARCGSFVVDLSLRYLNSAIARVAAEHADRATLVDLASVFRGHEGKEPVGWFTANPIRLACTDIHPNVAGHGAIAGAIWDVLAPRLR